MANARILQICDAVVALLQDTWTTNGITPAPTVVREYLPTIGDVDTGDALQGLNVFVFPTNYGFNELLDRSEYLNDRGVGIIVVQDYPAQAQDVPIAWLDNLVSFVEQQVYLVAGDKRTLTLLPNSDGTTGVWPETAEVTVVYDPDELRERKRFWSMVSIVYQEVM